MTLRAHKRLEQPAEDHGVGDVRDREFVEAQQRRFLDQVFGDGGDRIVALDLVRLLFLAPGENALVDVGHEGVEMDAALQFDLDESKNRSISMVLPRPTDPQM